jgi:6,7-dimethyl-8-ribityllumazine synthase
MKAKKLCCLILAADFNREIVDTMIEEAAHEAAEAGVEVLGVIRVLGSYELPLMVDVQLARPEVDFVVVLGYIERGETQHGEVMGHVVQEAIVDSQLRYRKPVGIGIIGPGATLEQARKRNVEYARSSVRAAVQSCRLLQRQNDSSRAGAHSSEHQQ